MKPLRVADPMESVLVLQDEIRRSADARYDHRLHGVLLVAQGMTCPEVGEVLGDSPRTVEYWVRSFNEEGLQGLAEGERPGRPGRLSEDDLGVIETALRGPRSATGLPEGLWDGKSLSRFVAERFGVVLGVRQSQRLFRKLGFRLRKPRPMIAKADPERHTRHKKNSGRS